MKLTVLVDNNVYIDHYYYGEPALSFYIEDGEDKILFDTGYSDIFLKNAAGLGIDLSQVTKLALSHGHNDHTGGLSIISDIFTKQKPEIVAHPLAFFPKKEEDVVIGSAVTLSELKENYRVRLTKEPIKISKNITFLGEIPELVNFEPRKQVGETKISQSYTPDYVLDDSALVFEGQDGIFVITGCSHSGISNICEYAKQVTGTQTIKGVIGGFHLFDINEQLEQTIRYFQENHITSLYPCHCVSFHAKAKIQSQLPIEEVGVGLHIEWY
ncbi:MBL fold metallo-hydrolase [Enterococcus ureilyticus]|uniref:MBL fold metallo-hydrolase n=1 Tax=Enterococcus ureilyticus TaxID=1131292 RepID=A0A1E5HEA3_9ENTE|nr:MBL fold metallo-hydrolase [Enterococcus ureilyticus]MBM7690008.1 7,8-dihydropterin-6-yl-methyl-4-(beta-D-ribofuranosyl)aminobenzene 5'-phosphate synthase [Enterococcus ureilyticus]MBO0445904.1 MBL fold metallo-hydrolase [Enterococcus ureilyticus]OEG22960.1 MBL fold metallo-hydrolase [Enterococcus ureilyticus]